VSGDSATTGFEAAKPPSRGRKLRTALLALGVGLVLAPIAAEVGLRILVSSPKVDANGLGKQFRRPELYSNSESQDDYWKLLARFKTDGARHDAPNKDALIGWTSLSVRPGNYSHVDESSIRGRKLVLLYGDSFARCPTMPEDSFPAIMERSDLAQDYVLLNYGAGGYGLDQVYLLIKNSIGRFEHLDPIVIVSALVEGDFDRSVLSFRTWPKPRLDIVGDQLVARGPVETSVQDYLAANPVQIQSYLWRLLLHQQSSILAEQRARWRGEASADQEKQVLNRRILVEIERELSSRKLRHFYLAFHAEPGALKPAKSSGWREQVLPEFCAQSGTQLIDTRTYLSFLSQGDEENCAEFYGHGPPLNGHHNALGNLVCFEAMRRGILGDSSEPEPRQIAVANKYGLFDWVGSESTQTVLMERPVTLTTYGSAGRMRASETAKPPQLLLRAGALGPTIARFELAGQAKRFTGRLRTGAKASGCGEAELRFFVEIDDKIVLNEAVPGARDALLLDIDLTGKQSFALVAVGDRGGGGCNWVCIEKPHLE